MQKVYIIKKNDEIYWNLNTFYKTEKRAFRSLYTHLEILLPKVNKKFSEIKDFHKDITIEEFIKDFEIIQIEI